MAFAHNQSVRWMMSKTVRKPHLYNPTTYCCTVRSRCYSIVKLCAVNSHYANSTNNSSSNNNNKNNDNTEFYIMALKCLVQLGN